MNHEAKESQRKRSNRIMFTWGGLCLLGNRESEYILVPSGVGERVCSSCCSVNLLLDLLGMMI